MPYLPGEIKPAEDTVGADVIFREAWRCITEDDVGIVGLYGVGGVGKTTLLIKINNQLIQDSSSSSSKLVIWVTVKRSATVEDVQQVIHNRLNLKDENWDRKKTDEKCSAICQFLTGKQFVLILDDLWEWLDLSKVGIPLPGPGSGNKKMVKIMITTRSRKVCSEMRAEKIIEVSCLPLPEAKALFNTEVGEETLNSHPEIGTLAEAMATCCGGLPIALKTIGRAMSGKREVGAWRRAERFMRESLSKIASMSSEVYPLLKLSYDSLSDETIKECFLYCALFSPGFEIPTEMLIQFWIVEGILHDDDDNASIKAWAPALVSDHTSEIPDNYNNNNGLSKVSITYVNTGDPRLPTWALEKGSEIIESLKSACLLETGAEYRNCVKMHDVVRDMALWIIHQEGKSWDKRKNARMMREKRVQGIRRLRLYMDQFQTQLIKKNTYPHQKLEFQIHIM